MDVGAQRHPASRFSSPPHPTPKPHPIDTPEAAELAFRQRFCVLLDARRRAMGVRAEDIAALLGLSRRITYRRLAGETPFSGYELALLCRTYGISSSLLWEQPPVPLLTFAAPIPPDTPFDEAAFLARLRMAALDGEKQATHAALSSDYLPTLHVYRYDDLALLWLYLTALPDALTTAQPLELAPYGEAHGEWLAASRDQAANWSRIDSEEVWGYHPLDFLVTRIESLAVSGLLADAATTSRIFDALDSLIADLRAALPAGRKPGGEGAWTVHRAWSTSIPNVFLLRGPQLASVFVPMTPSSFLATTQPEANAYFDRYVAAQARLADRVTGHIAHAHALCDAMAARVTRGRRRVSLHAD